MKLNFLIACICTLFSMVAFADNEKEIKVGDPSPDFQYENRDGKVYSLKDFRGKYVLIDVWATYCSPCKKEIPFLEKIQEKFKNKNIVFVGIATDGVKAEWIKFLDQNKLKGIQLIMDRKWISFMHRYQVSTIPRYILLDKEGKIVNMNMPLPSDPEFVKILKSLKGL